HNHSHKHNKQQYNQYKNHPYPKPNGTDVLKQQNQSIDIGKKNKIIITTPSTNPPTPQPPQKQSTQTHQKTQ
ncbi:MAG: hypothetical protein O7C59_09025, partial [Rickettsia endosymbiont of Ixodes persulcatus]|nr:hypothetical protein [Rickettsia endosymbiont of Ixodes persulcatus]